MTQRFWFYHLVITCIIGGLLPGAFLLYVFESPFWALLYAWRIGLPTVAYMVHSLLPWVEEASLLPFELLLSPSSCAARDSLPSS